jgi:Neocarzinostatin family
MTRDQSGSRGKVNQMRRWQQKGRLGVVAAASFVLLVLVLPQVATGIGLGSLAARLTDSGACGSSGSSGSGSFGSGGSGSGSGSTCGPLSLTASPDKKLADAQTIVVDGSGFPPYTSVGIAECKAGATGQNGCDLGTLVETGTDGSGSFVLPYSVSRLISTTNAQGMSVSTDCALDPCILAAAETSNQAVAAVTTIGFNPKIPPVFQETVSSTDNVISSTGVAEIAGTFICRQPLVIELFINLDQHRGRFNVENETFSSVTCKGHSKWVVPVPSEYGIAVFGPGKATVNAAFSTRIGNSYRSVDVSSKITLTGVTKK